MKSILVLLTILVLLVGIPTVNAQDEPVEDDSAVVIVETIPEIIFYVVLAGTALIAAGVSGVAVVLQRASLEAARSAYEQAGQKERQLIDNLAALSNRLERLAYDVVPTSFVYTVLDRAEDALDVVTGEIDTEPNDGQVPPDSPFNPQPSTLSETNSE